MSDQRTATTAGVGAVGLAAGVVAAASGKRHAALLAGAAAALSAWIARHQGDQLAAADMRAKALDDQIRQLENAVASQVQSRMAAEAAVRSLTGQLSEAERRAGDTSDGRLIITPGANDNDGLTDNETGLFHHDYFLVSLDSRISAARRHLRPVAVAIAEVVVGREGEERPVADPALVADSLRYTLRESDTAARLTDGRYGIVLEDTPENGAIWTMERFRRHLSEQDPNLTLRVGISCYPAHAFDVGALIDRAEVALESAREWHQDRIEIATAE